MESEIFQCMEEGNHTPVDYALPVNTDLRMAGLAPSGRVTWKGLWSMGFAAGGVHKVS